MAPNPGPKALSKISQAERQSKAAELYAQGLSMAAIGSMLGVCAATIYKDIQAAKALWRETSVEAIERLNDEHIRRTEELYQALLPGIRSGSPRSIEVAIKVLERQSKLLGLDAPEERKVNAITKVEVEYIDTPPQAT